LIWRFEGGKYRLNYELRLRKNEPVKASPIRAGDRMDSRGVRID
jgi:hypothetical protein